MKLFDIFFKLGEQLTSNTHEKTADMGQLDPVINKLIKPIILL